MATFELDDFLAMPRVTGLALSPDGTRLITSVATVAADGKRYVSALWELDPAGKAEPKRLTRSAKGESPGAFLPDGGFLFSSTRPDPDAKPDAPDDERRGLWLLPAGGGEARLVADPPGGVDGLAVARSSGAVALGIGTFPGTESLEEDGERFKARKETGMVAQLFESYPIRHWDHYLGPRERQIFVAAPLPARDTPMDLRRVAGGEAHSLNEVDFDLTPDGSTLVTGRRRLGTALAVDVVAVDVSTGEARELAASDAVHAGVACAPDGGRVVCRRQTLGNPGEAAEVTLWLIDLAGGQGRDLIPGFDQWPKKPVWAPDSQAVFFAAYEAGRAPVFRVDVATGVVTRLSADGAFSDLCPSPDGSTLYALRSRISSPQEVVALDARAPDQDPRPIPTPRVPVTVPGRVEEMVATAADGVAIHSWLVLPEAASEASPAPLVLWIHGGPLGSWNEWLWRWNPWVLAARGYAVLLPDPALSTGYGQAFIQRGWGRWGAEPFTDLMAAVDAAVARPDIDPERTAAMGGSFGGYMANWVAGHTHRFRAIVTHASLWALDQFHGTTDEGQWWECEFGNPYEDPHRYEENSPHRHIARITTPVLVTHGELDHRVPVGEALRLWTDLRRNGVPAKFLYFPDENHWILKPQNTRVWFQTVIAWLDQHLLGKDWERPALL